MFGVGFWEIAFIAVLALIFIGPEDLPKTARKLGQILNELRKGRDDFLHQLQSSDKALEQKVSELLKDEKQTYPENQASSNEQTGKTDS